MSKKKDFFYNIMPNDTMDDYVCKVNIHGKEYPYEQIGYLNNVSENVSIKKVFDNETGEVLLEKTNNYISENNSRIHRYTNCCDFAKSKNIPRTSVQSNNKHIIELCQEHSEFLQASTGSSHDKRGIITADLDIKRPDHVKTHRQTKEYVINYLQKRFEMSEALGIPLPTSYQIHLTNGHAQLYWVLDREIKIKKLSSKNVSNNGSAKRMFFLENNDMWNPYMRVMRFLNILYGGDPAFTGWQIKNMFLTDKIFLRSFLTIWNNNNVWTEDQPSKLKTFKFEHLNNIVNDYILDPSSDKFTLISDLISGFGISNTKFKELVCAEFLISNSLISRYGVSVKAITSNKSTNANLNYGRNQFVRMKTFEVIRAYDNKISKQKCKVIVKNLLKNEINKKGTLRGTKNKTPYTQKDFERDFNATYDYGVLTYDKNKRSFNGYTQEQRERAECQKHAKVNARLSTLLVILEEHPNLIPDNSKNCKELIIIFKQYGIVIKSNNTISNYKKNLGIKKNQTKLSPKNYKKADAGYAERISYKNELCNAYSKMDKSKMSDEKINSWKKRIKNLDTSQIESQFIKRKRFSLKWHAILYKPNSTYNDNLDIIIYKELLKNTHNKEPFLVMRT